MTGGSHAQRETSVAFLSAEVSPYAKVGGLGDVAGSLPPALRSRGIPIVVLMPRYGSIDLAQHGAKLVAEGLEVAAGSLRERFSVYRCELPGGTPVLMLDNPRLYGGQRVYDDALDRERSAFLCKAAPAMLAAIGETATVVHANDWHTAAAMLEPGDVGRVFTIHNLAHQGIIDEDYAVSLGIPTGPLLGVEQLGQYPGKLNLMARAIVSADVVTTVSPRYAAEITTPQFGAGLDALLRERGDDLVGILNGIDIDAFDPERDRSIEAHFSAADPSGKAVDKAAMQRELGLDVSAQTPLIGVVSRLDDQKGFDLILGGIEAILGLGVQVAVLGTGAREYHDALERLSARFPTTLAARLTFDARLAQVIYAGSDMFLMPSRFEPCGLGQMIAMRYGTVPIVRATGGLADTVSESSGGQNGFTFVEYDVDALVAAVRRAVGAFRDAERWRAIVARGMARDASWDRAAEDYIGVYKRALDASVARRGVLAG